MLSSTDWASGKMTNELSSYSESASQLRKKHVPWTCTIKYIEYQILFKEKGIGNGMNSEETALGNTWRSFTNNCPNPSTSFVILS